MATRYVRAPSFGLLKVRLTAARGDWDIGVFDARTGRTVAGSSHFRSRELAEGFVAKGQGLRAQACCRSGKSRSARFTVEFQAIKTPKKVQRAQLVRVSTPTRAAARKLLALGLDLTEHGGKRSLDVVLRGAADARTVRRAGLAYVVRVKDLAARGRADRRADAR